MAGPPLEGLAAALAHEHPALAVAPLCPLPDTGLAHWHVRLGRTGWLARIPKQSQMGWPAAQNLAYQSACFRRAQPSGHTPGWFATLAPRDGLPRGALVVEAVEGRPARLPQDLPAIVDALAALHALPLPGVRAPLLAPVDPVQAMVDEVLAQSVHRHEAALDRFVLADLEARLSRLAGLARAIPTPCPHRLIAFDAHPGNFLVRADGRAILVDLEKARYGAAPLDLAHATLYTSTTWDVSSRAVLSPDDVARACQRWLERAGLQAEAMRPWIVPLREAMWLWSLTWCALWRVRSTARPDTGANADWSASNSDPALIEHVRERVDHYLAPETVRRVGREIDALGERLA
ncbi:MAG: aminoglycoside phosphotransferase family protein [Ideonella sp.]|jgi:hypothetical protein|nr:aminoglycoside phosphotransferase family protein [Ideonella sp.]